MIPCPIPSLTNKKQTKPLKSNLPKPRPSHHLLLHPLLANRDLTAPIQPSRLSPSCSHRSPSCHMRPQTLDLIPDSHSSSLIHKSVQYVPQSISHRTQKGSHSTPMHPSATIIDCRLLNVARDRRKDKGDHFHSHPSLLLLVLVSTAIEYG